MAEQPPERQLGRLSAAKIATFVGALLAAIGLNGLVNYLKRRAERKQTEQKQQHEAERRAEIAQKRDLGHEPTAVQIGPLLAILAGSIAFAAVAGVALWALLYVLSTNAQRSDTPLSPLGTAGPPPEPRLQVDPPADWQTMRATDEAALNSSGQQPDGSLHIPIDRAMDLLAQRGLPAAAGTPGGLSDHAAHNLASAGGQPPGGIPEPASATSAAEPSPSPSAQAAATMQPGPMPTPQRSAP